MRRLASGRWRTIFRTSARTDSRAQRKAIVDRTEPLPATRQRELLNLPRPTFSHMPKPVSEEALELMKLIDRCHLKHPYYGSRHIRDWLADEGYRVNRKRVQRLMHTMGLVALYPKRNSVSPTRRTRFIRICLRTW